MLNAIARFIRDEEGATAIEYGVIAGLITILLVVLFNPTATTGFAGAIKSLFTNLSTQLTKAVPAS
ncbi:pilus assembly protein [Variovorax paradoxus]|jgi:pilus assembly protein Flp/PilA|uniref:Flp family type IVb pilin n=1 Tax=Variovorax paradoxus TaxID=34073 RepID=UPI0006E6C89A|nr:pilus assembly protein [Variovorax paradoxus]KPU97993.1 pilus assembly protein [Variovorax paradoxus]KPV00704.1 pilus assembly protein [Variovorax paradoxus]KPV16309.1 pilus assembly protein [Variovorax paradoxus]KPV27351.1 pilus assembly protein [Variovorax paradoxus]